MHTKPAAQSGHCTCDHEGLLSFNEDAFHWSAHRFHWIAHRSHVSTPQ